MIFKSFQFNYIKLYYSIFKMDNNNHIIRFIFYLSVIVLLVLYLFPGSLIGYILYNDLSTQPNLISNPIGTSINHFIYFFYLSTIGLLSYLDNTSFNKIFIFIFLLSVILEILHLIVPNRSFEYLDFIANISGVLVGYCLMIIYKRWKKYE